MDQSLRNEINNYIKDSFIISDKILSLAVESEDELKDSFQYAEMVSEYNQARVLKAFQENNVSDMHFAWNTGYGYDDAGRDAVERVFASAFGGEKALVRPNIVNGTHAISLAILGLLKRGDKLIYVSGTPYDTLQSVIGYDINNENGSFTGTAKDLGIEYEVIDLLDDGNFDIETINNRINSFYSDNASIGHSNNTSAHSSNSAYEDSGNNYTKRIMIAIQRSKGYSLRNTITVKQIENLIDVLKENEYSRHNIVMVDNCYCEFTEVNNPIDVGCDIICGSLIKNPGGGLALSGGYLVGRADLIDQAAYRLTCPGIGGECGLTFGQNRAVLQGLFQGPRVTSGAIKGAMLLAKLFQKLGFDVYPKPGDNNRCDIIQAVKLDSPERVQAFCSGIQSAAPIDSTVTPVPAPMPGYEDDVIMAAGTFVQGSSIELSADGPLREPYAVYFQGGLTYEHSKIGVLMAAQSLLNQGLI